MQGTFVSLLMPFIGVLFVILLAYLGTKYISQKYAKMSTGRHLRVIERVALGQDKSLVLLTVNKKAYLLGVTAKGINTVCEFAENDLPTDSGQQNQDFSKILRDSLKKYNIFHLPQNKEEIDEKDTDKQ